MIIVFNCPSCGAILRMKEKYGGQRGRCPHCQAAITVPAIETEDGMDLVPLEGAPAAEASPSQPAKSEPAPFSITSRLRQPSPPVGGGSAPLRSPAGDSNIGLAPIEEHPGKVAASGKAAPAEPVASTNQGERSIPRPDASPTADSAVDEDFSLAPLGEGSGKVASRSAAAPAASGALPTTAGGDAAPKTAADERQRIVCTSCGAKIRIPAAAAGRQITCPRCKKKQRVPEKQEKAGEPVADQGGAAVSLDDASGSGQDLNVGILDALGEGAPLAAAAAEPSAGGALLTPSKSSGRRAKAGTILGMPAIAVYGGAAGVTALVVGLILVWAFTGSGGGAAPRPAGSPQVAQAPAPAPTNPQPTAKAPPAPAPAPRNPVAPPGGSFTQPPGAQPAMPNPMPTGTPPSASPAANPGTPAAARTPAAPDNTPDPGTPAKAPAPSPNAAPPSTVNWRGRIPIVRMLAAYASADGEAAPAPAPSDAPPPRRKDLKPGEKKEMLELPAKIMKIQEQLLADIKQIVDADSARKLASHWADATSQGMESVKKLKGYEGANLGLFDAANHRINMQKEQETVVQLEAETQRAAQVPDVMAILDAALEERAKQQPNGALAEARGAAGPPAGS